MTTSERSRDTAVRAMTEDGSFRVVAVDVTDTARAMIAAQRASGADATRFAELTAGAVLFRETMAPDLRAQCVLNGSQGSGRIVVDAQPEGRTRGLVAVRKGAPEVLLGPGAQLEMLRTLPERRGFRGVVEVPVGGGVSQAMMEYMQTSEQIVTMVSIAAPEREDGTIARVLGYLVQLTPETRREPLAVMTERLSAFESIADRALDPSCTPAALVRALLEGMPHEVLAEAPVSFSCNCSEERVLTSLTSISRGDLEELLSSGEPVELTCDYCNTDYVIAHARLRGLLSPS